MTTPSKWCRSRRTGRSRQGLRLNVGSVPGVPGAILGFAIRFGCMWLQGSFSAGTARVAIHAAAATPVTTPYGRQYRIRYSGVATRRGAGLGVNPTGLDKRRDPTLTSWVFFLPRRRLVIYERWIGADPGNRSFFGFCGVRDPPNPRQLIQKLSTKRSYPKHRGRKHLFP